MLKKLFVSAVTLCAFAAAFATDYARIDLNFWCNGNLKCLTVKAPAGVQIVPRRVLQGKDNFCYYSLTVNLEKVSAEGFELKYEVLDTGDRDSAKIIPSITPIRLTGGKRESCEIECLEFEIDDEISTLTPCKISKWTKMLDGGKGITVSKGDKFVVKAKFRTTAAK